MKTVKNNIIEGIYIKEFANTIKSICGKSIVGASESGVGTGFQLVSPSIQTEIMDGLKYTSKVMSKARVYDVSAIQGNTFIQPWFDSSLEDEPSTGTRCYFVDEGGTKTESIPLEDATAFKLGKITCKITFTDYLLEDNERIVDWFISQSQSKIAQKIDKKSFFGVGLPIKGVLGDGDNATVEVATAANVFSKANAVSFINALHPSAENAEWYFSKLQEKTILSQDYTQQNALVFENGKYYLFGRPVNILPALTSSPYSAVLADFTNYVFFHKTITIRRDPQTNFLTDQTTLLVEMRIAGGMCINTSKLDDGTTYGFVVAEEGGEAGGSSSSSSSSSESSQSLSSSSSSEGNSELSSSSSSESTESSSTSSETSESLEDVIVSGTLSPDLTGTYVASGSLYGGQEYYANATSSYVWFDIDNSKWVISTEPGDIVPSWSGDNLLGTYSNVNGATGTATVTI